MGTLYVIEDTVGRGVYVGKTMSPVEKRWTVHRSRLNRGVHHSRPLQDAWNNHGAAAFTWRIVANIEAEEALDKAEIALIAELRASDYSVYNHAPGGKGNVGYVPTEETRRKLSRISRERLADPEVKRRLIAGLRRRYSDPEARARQREVLKATRTPEALAKKGATQRRRYREDADYRARRLKTLEAAHSPEAHAKIAEATRESWSDPEIRKARIEGQKQAFATPESKERRSAASRRRYENQATHEQVRAALEKPRTDPDVRARQLAASRAAAALRRGESPKPYRYRLVSPTGEVIIVDSLKQFCDEHGLHNANMYAVVHGKRKSHHGWTVTIEPLPDSEP